MNLVVAGVIAGTGLSGCSSGHHNGTSPSQNATTSTSTSVASVGIATVAPTPPNANPCPVAATPMTGMSPPPQGVVAMTIYGPRRVPFPSEVFTDPSVSGVDLLVQWSYLEPQRGDIDWSILDCVFEQADAHDKFVVLTLIPGFASPSWVLRLPGVRTQSFTFSYNNNAPARPLPLPWDQSYLSSWFTFLGAVAGRYGTNPAFRMIEVAGPTSVSSEMSLPDRTSGDAALPSSTGGSDVAEWMALGYTPTRYVAAWKQVFAEYHHLFPDQYLGLALYPGLPIGDNGGPDPSQVVATRLDIVAVGLQYKAQFDLQEDGIKGATSPPSDPGYNTVTANCGNVVTGLQNAKSATISPADQGPLTLALQRVAAAGVKFWEVYTEDVVNPSMHSVIATASTELPAGAGCKPLVLGAGARTGGTVTITAMTDLHLNPAEKLNIYDGTTLLRTCSSNTCSVRASPGTGATVFTADVGEAGTPPYTTQAVISAATTVAS